MTDASWLEYSTTSQKRKRAALACQLCHSKKIKCDLEQRSTQGNNVCTNCSVARKSCEVRPPKRDRLRQNATLAQPLTPPGESVSSVDDPSRSTVRHHQDMSDLLNSPLSSIPTTMNQAHDDRSTQSQAPLQNIITRPPIGRAPSLVTGTTPGSVSDRWAVDPGFLQVYGPENENDARVQAMTTRKEPNLLEMSQPDLQQSFLETYFEFCYAFCPVLDKSSVQIDLAQSPLLDDALALIGSHLRPPMIPHASPASYYDRARRRFYEDEEADLVTSLKAISLFYWWSPRPPSMVHRHSSWWWTSTVIRHCQQAGFHHESGLDQSDSQANLGLRRRIWWTAFVCNRPVCVHCHGQALILQARERLTAICQGKPCLIDPEDCNIPEPSLDDFPIDQDTAKAETFIYWVRLCAIIGKIAKHLSRRSSATTSAPFPVHLGKELIDWQRSLPSHLQLPIGGAYTTNFNRDAHQLHLPYLTIIIILYLKRTPDAALPQALPPSVLAASCIARILKDILVRSGTRHLMAITCWYCGMAFIALTKASLDAEFKADADADLDILALSVKQLQTMWGTANVFDKGFERLRANAGSFQADDHLNTLITDDTTDRALGTDDGIEWLEYFPFVTAQTSPIAEKLLAQQSIQLFPFDNICDSSLMLFQGLFEGLDTWNRLC